MNEFENKTPEENNPESSTPDVQPTLNAQAEKPAEAAQQPPLSPYAPPYSAVPPQATPASPYSAVPPQVPPASPYSAVPPQAPPYTPYPGYTQNNATPYTYPYGQPPVYTQPPKRRMPLGLKVLVIVLSVLFGVSVLGFAGFGIYTAAAGDNTSSYPDSFPDNSDNSGFERPGDTPDSDENNEDAQITIPDVDVTPNTEGITLHDAPKGAELDISAAYNKVIPSTVLVITENETSGGTGTGIIATEDGYIITNSHVVLNTKNVTVQVKTNDGTMHDAVVVGLDKTTDLAVLKIDGSGYTPAEFGNSDALAMGQWVVAIGNPGGEQFSGSLTRGVISGLNRTVGTYSANGMTYIQTDAAINPGNSGGPLVNLYGQVVGINSAKIVSDEYEGMGFAIPISGARDIINDLLSGGYVQGRVRFGITGTDISEMQASMYGVPAGFMIASIDKDSCFNGTNVQQYDIITAIDDVETPSLAALSNALLAYQPGDTVTISLFRPSESGQGGESFTVQITLLEDKGETQG